MNHFEIFCCFLVALYCVGEIEGMSHGCTYCYPQMKHCKYGKYIDNCGCVLCSNQAGRMSDTKASGEETTKEETSNAAVVDYYKDNMIDSKTWSSKKLKRLIERRESLNRILSDIARREMETEEELFR